MKKYKGVIFDLDGLLIDSERMGIENAVKVAERMNVPITREVVKKTIGITYADTIACYLEHVGEKDKLDAFLKEESKAYDRLMDNNLVPLKPGAAELLEYLNNKGYQMVIASSSSHRYIVRMLEPKGVLGYFRDIISSNDVTKGKPDPQVFLIAASRMGLKPEECVVFEDSLNGLLAAVNGNFDCILVPDVISFSDEELKKATYVFDSLEEVVKTDIF